MSNPALSQSPKLAEQSLPAVVRKSRDSGFVGSLDDLLRRDAGGESTPTGASSCNMGSSDSGHSLSDGEGSTSASNSGATATPSVVSSASKRGQTGAMQLEKVDEENLATDGAATSSSQASSPSHAPYRQPCHHHHHQPQLTSHLKGGSCRTKSRFFSREPPRELC